jgi:hypothetical protein
MEMAKVNEAKYNLSLKGIKFKGLKTKRKAKRTKKAEASNDGK